MMTASRFIGKPDRRAMPAAQVALDDPFLRHREFDARVRDSSLADNHAQIVQG